MSYRKGHHFSLKDLKFKEYVGVDFTEMSTEDLRDLWREMLKNGLHGLCFSMYEDNQKPGETISELQVRKRIQIIKPYIKWVRSFSCIEGNEHIPRVAHQNGIKTLVGAWLGDDLEKNEAEIESLISLAKEGVVDIAAVGNEVLYRKELTEKQLLEYIHRVKEAIPEVPVGYVDAYYEFTDRPKIADACDVILSNCYPYWEGCDIGHSLNHMRQMYHHARDAAKGKRIIITETGWPSEGGNLREAHASPENAMKYFINTQVWAENQGVEVFYFSSFDEGWKTGTEGDVGAYWGLWDKNGNLKF